MIIKTMISLLFDQQDTNFGLKYWSFALFIAFIL